MTDRYDELRATPDPVLAEQLRQRLHARMAHGSLGDRAASSGPGLAIAPPDVDDGFVPMKEMHMSIDPPQTDHRNRWWIVAAAAAVVVVGVAGVALVVDRDDDADDGVQQAPATTDIPTTTAAPRIEQGVLAASDPSVRFAYVVPEGWEVPEDSGGTLVASDSLTVNFWDVGRVYADGCEWELLDPPLGPTVDDLANVWADLPGFTATTPVDITVDGYAGKQLDYTLPEYDQNECDGGKFALWIENGLERSGPNFWGQVPGQQNRQVILDVDGTRLVINAWADPDQPPEVFDGLDQILDTLEIG